MLEATIWSQVVYTKGCNLQYSLIQWQLQISSCIKNCQFLDLRYRNVLLNLNNINQSLFVFFVSGCKVCQYCLIRSVSLTAIKFLIIFMFIEFLINKFFQSCSARTGFIPMDDAFVAVSVANDLLDQIFICQVLFQCINQQHNIFISFSQRVQQP